MGRKSSIARLDPDVRQYIEKLLRDDQLTLDELLDNVRKQYPQTEAPSRSSLHRYQASFTEMTGRMREIETAAGALVGELGEGMGDRAGALLAQAVTTLAVNAALKANERDGEISIKEVGELARAARAAMQARTMSIKERQAIAEEAREILLREQKEKMAKLEKEGSKNGRFDAETLRIIRQEIYGIA